MEKRKDYESSKIGVITPVYNDTEHLFHAINSVKSQNLGNVVHYIYDDCSTDGLVDAIHDIMKENKSIIYLKGIENKGQSHARNEAIKAALSDGCNYLAFLDSDDVWFEGHLQLDD